MIKGKSLILTGASMGLGRALAVSLASNRARLVINARNKAQLEETRSLVTEGDKPTIVAGDASQAATAKELVEAALDLGDFGGFVHAAGMFHPGPALWELTDQQYDDIFAANTKAGWQLLRHAVPALMPKGQGLAVFLGSKAADLIQPGIAAYCTAKLALETLCRQLAAEAPWLTTFVYRPGLVDTRMQRQAREAEGGSASPVRTMFGSWHEKGYLVSPETSAARLVETINGDLTGISGAIIDFAAKKKK